MIVQCFPCGPISTNGYLLGCSETRKAVLIDAPEDVWKEAIPYINKHNLSVEKLLLTHSHWDHILDAAICEKQGLSVWVHSNDSANVTKPGSDKLPMFSSWEKVSSVNLLEEGQKIEVGNLEITVLHTPGHSPGCVCFYIEKKHVLFSGDTLFQGAMGRVDLPTGNPSDMRVSLKRLSKLPKNTQVFPGHGAETTIGAEGWLLEIK